MLHLLDYCVLCQYLCQVSTTTNNEEPINNDFKILKEKGVAYPSDHRTCLPAARDRYHFSLIS